MRRLFFAVLALLVVIGSVGCENAENGAVETGAASRPVTEVDTSAGGRAAAQFDTYSNDRFGFSVEYPSGILTSVDRSQNGDGAVLSSDSLDVTLRVYASHNVQNETLVEVLNTAREDFSSVESEEGRQTTATLRGIGTDGNRHVEHVELREDNLFTLELSYPEGALEPGTVERIVGSFDVDPDDEPTGFKVKVALLDYAATGGQYEKESSGKERGCDRVVMVDRNVPRTDAPLTAALDELFSLEQENMEGWQNFIARTNETLSFDRATVEDGTASIYLAGELSGLRGVCDNPRARIQIEETALNFPTVDSVAIYLDGRRTDLQPDGRGER